MSQLNPKLAFNPLLDEIGKVFLYYVYAQDSFNLSALYINRCLENQKKDLLSWKLTCLVCAQWIEGGDNGT